jgi:LPXTG-site transpeptidase (sortase) family protein
VTQDKAGDRVSGLSKRLFVLFLVMVIAGFVLPSPGVSAPKPAIGQSEYHALAAPSAPELLIVPSIDIKAPVLPIEVDANGVLHPPSNYHDVGWWKRSAKPGSPTGQTLITGHTVHTGGGVMNRLGELRPGALVQIKTELGTLDYRTTRVFVYTKQELADNAVQLFGQKRQHNRLVLVTCTGWTGHDYTSNIIVFADPLGVRNGTDTTASPTGTPTASPTDTATGDATGVGGPE